MHNIIKKIEEKYKLYKTKGASNELIEEAQRQLNRKFANDYKEYLSKYGAISFGPYELTGLNIDSYANVVAVTLKEIQMTKNFPKDAIVLENTGNEGILILQNSDGEVYEWKDGKKGKKFTNLEEYLSELFHRLTNV